MGRRKKMADKYFTAGDIIQDWLIDHGFDGLANFSNVDELCGCGIDDLFPCGDPNLRECKAALKVEGVEGAGYRPIDKWCGDDLVICPRCQFHALEKFETCPRCLHNFGEAVK